MRHMRTAATATLLILAPLGVFALAEQPDTPRLELGPQVTQIYLPVNPVGSVQYQPGFGAVASVKLSRIFGVDSGFSITPTIPLTGTSFAGGRLTQGLIGARVGFAFRHLEIYGKIRPGFASFGDAILHAVSTPNLQFQVGRLTEPALDVGAIVVLRISHRLGVRYEIGDTMIHYQSRTIDASQPPVAGRLVNNLQLGGALVFGF